MATILIVEDRRIDRRLLAAILSSGGHAVIEAADGIEALALLRDACPDVVISDILMPSIDGYELVRRMRELPHLATTPVIFYTATYHEREARELARRCGVAAILTKPMRAEELLAAVAAVLEAPSATDGPVAGDSFDRDHLTLVSSTLASKIADLERSEERLGGVVEIAQEIAAERDAHTVLTRVCEAARRVTFAQHAILRVFEHPGSTPHSFVATGLDEPTLRAMSVPTPETPMLREVWVDRSVVRRVNPSGNPRDLGLPADHPPVHSIVIAPVASPSQVYGWLALRNKLGADEFSSSDEALARSLATLAGVAYENARLLAEARKHADELRRQVEDRTRAEEALRIAEARTEFALAGAGIGVWEWNIAEDSVTWTRTAAAAFGIPVSNAPRDSAELIEFVHPTDRERFEQTFKDAMTSGSDFELDFRAFDRDGKTRTIVTRGRALYEHERPVKIIAVSADVTAQRSMEQQFRQAQKMEAIGHLAGGVAHDFNNVLTTILGRAEFLREDEELPHRLRDDVREITAAAERAAGLTHQLLAFSRKQLLQPTRLDLNTTVTGTTQMLRRLIGEHIELRTVLAPDLMPIFGDPSQIDQILINLVVNARDAMPTGGRLTIETANVELDAEYAEHHPSVKPGMYVALTISDTGIGMDEETRRRIFEPFFTTKERGKGTGLGLSTVYGIVKQSGGYIWVYSEPGQGAVFKVYFPRTTEAAVPPPPAAPTRAHTGTELILLVEDENAVRALTRSILQRAGYRVLDAADPVEAEKLFREHSPDIAIVITDIVLPNMSGVTLYHRLQERSPGLKVLYTSGYTDTSIVADGRLDATVAFLQKPFTASALRSKVRAVLDHGARHDAI